MRKVFVILFIFCLAINSVFAQEEEDTKAHIRIVHLSVDASDVDIYINADDSEIHQETYDFGDVSDWIEVDPDTYSIAVVPAEGEIEDAVLEAERELEAGDWVTFAAIGEVEKETISLQALEEDYSELGAFQSRLSVFHAVPNYDPINVFVNDVELIRFLGYPGFWGPDSDGFISFDILAQSSDIRLEQDDGTVAAELEDIVLGGNRHYFLAVAGVPSDPQFVFVAADLEAITESE